jgi:hypothetical protein
METDWHLPGVKCRPLPAAPLPAEGALPPRRSRPCLPAFRSTWKAYLNGLAHCRAQPGVEFALEILLPAVLVGRVSWDFFRLAVAGGERWLPGGRPGGKVWPPGGGHWRRRPATWR